MPKAKTQYTCQSCGNMSSKWSGQCEGCGQWDSISEEVGQADYSVTSSSKKGTKRAFVSLQGESKEVPRIDTGLDELNRVLGSGLVRGSAILLGGDPGIGKSTLVLQTLSNLALGGHEIAYISGEESVDQIRLRAKRLGVESSPVNLLTATSVKDILASVKTVPKLDVLVIDSIQTMFIEEISSAPGTVSQIRMASHELIRYCKHHNIALILIGHVTKDGQIAGPKLLEHMVDTVLYFEGERGHHYRILRAVKNRFGAANEIGVFEMQQKGLAQVSNPSSLFLSERTDDVSGVTVFAGIEGTRPILIEIQALVMDSPIPTPRRAVVGWDNNRLAMLVAVIHSRYGLFMADKDIYLNVTGGMKIQEPAVDLAVACALLSNITNTPLPKGCVIFGEIGLSGEIRMVSQADIRVKEAQKLGFTQAIVPFGMKNSNNSFLLNPIKHIKDLTYLFAEDRQKETAC